MAYKIDPAKPLDAQLRHVAIQQIDRAADTLSALGDDPHEAIHEARKRFKKLRGLIRLLRPADEQLYKSLNALFRDAAKGLSDVRDKAALVEAIDKLEAHVAGEVATDAFGPVRAKLTADRDKAMETSAAHQGEAVETALVNLAKAKTQMEGFVIGDGRRKVKREAQLIAEGMALTYGRARKALKTAKRSRQADDLHELRKRMKYHWMHLRLVSPLWPDGFEPAIKLAKAIADDLGDDHDYAVFRAGLTETPESFGDPQSLSVVLALMDRRQSELRQGSLDAARRLLIEREDALEERIEGLYRHGAEIASRDTGMPAEAPDLAERRRASA
ncbi:MAG: CHAD domain-containing protein [Fulvimarina manganoxydans]|uniref:CHAD domain-containing protein n=1 Tax=Fulvimarina manganoxydans TaxID=937218 RepID=UPI002352D465|nr:CHAD domain-containing protein [Fulvimarina manganoxydans]MCK5931731.1 CHAD domain-containing protein [Fulvimarina manganoxydans]